MGVEFGAKVVDKDGKTLGTVAHIVNDTWTGELRKFIVRRKAPDEDLFLSAKDILEITDDVIRLNGTFP